MGIGVGIFLVALGAGLTFAVNASVRGLDIHVVGVILMAAGALGIVLELALFAPRRRTTFGAVVPPAGRTVLPDDRAY